MTTPSNQLLMGALPHVRFEIVSFLFEPKDDGKDHFLTESLLFRRVAHARALMSFFSDKRPRPKNYEDDVLSDDYGFPHSSPFDATTKKDLAKRINKHLFHLSYDRIGLSGSAKRWPVEKIFPPLETLCGDFVRYMLKDRRDLIDADESKAWQAIEDGARTGSLSVAPTDNVSVKSLTVSFQFFRKDAKPTFFLHAAAG